MNKVDLMKKRYLVLADGTVFEGYAFGADCDSIGELIFNTSVVGYIETLTDPSYYGQIVLQTFPAIGNYGIIESDFIGESTLKGYAVREWCDAPSNFRCEYDINKFLIDRGIPGIYGIDTREITNIIRDKGTMNAIICDEIPTSLDEVVAYKIVGAVESTSGKNKTEYVPKEEAKGHIAILDLGSSKHLETKLLDEGYKVTLLPYDTAAEDILAVGADALVITEGAGDPREISSVAAEVAKLFGKVPMVGIGLGHQLMAMAKGAEIIKLPYGHHGSNQPAKLVGTHKTSMTSQNHGYAVDGDTVKCGEVNYININDNSVEGIVYKGEKALSVQFELTAEEVIAKINEAKED